MTDIERPANYRWRSRGGKGKFSRFVGVRKHGRKWVARMWVGYKQEILGTFDTEEEAARCYDRHSLTERGYKVNFP